MTDPGLLAWFRRAVTALVAEAEREHGDLVQRRSKVAGAALEAAVQKPFEATPVGAIRHLPVPSADHPALVNDFLPLAHTLPWRPSHRVDDGGDLVALLDLFDCIDLGNDLSGAGLLLLGPGAEYPEHKHPPAEVYLILHGARRWRFGGSDQYVKVDPGQVISNSGNDVHCVQPGDDGLLALWVLMDDR